MILRLYFVRLNLSEQLLPHLQMHEPLATCFSVRVLLFGTRPTLVPLYPHCTSSMSSCTYRYSSVDLYSVQILFSLWRLQYPLQRP